MSGNPHERVVICGGPRTGKTTLGARLAEQLGCKALCTDAVMHLGWSEASAEVATWFLHPGPWVIEGAAAVRALRKWFKLASTVAPCDRVIFLREPHVELSPRQRGMAGGCETIWREVLPSLEAICVPVDDAGRA